MWLTPYIAEPEVRQLGHLLGKLGIKIPPPILFCDNIDTTFQCANPVFHSRMKHIALDYHFVCQGVQKCQLQVSHIVIKDQLVEILTKPSQPISQFTQLRDKMDVTNDNPISRVDTRISPLGVVALNLLGKHLRIRNKYCYVNNLDTTNYSIAFMYNVKILDKEQCIRDVLGLTEREHENRLSHCRLGLTI